MSTAAENLWPLLNPLNWWRAARGRFAGKARCTAPDPQSRHPFDRKHGVDTSGLIYADGLGTGHEHDIHSAGYYATAPSLFHAAIERWSETLAGSGRSLGDYALVDVGCGKGRVVLLAAGYPFREIEGVELNAGLAEVARKNLARWMGRQATFPGLQHRETLGTHRVRIVCADALATPVPDGPVVLFFFNSFEQEMVRMWLERLVEMAEGRKEPIDVIYLHPEHAALFERTPGMEVVADEVFAFSAADAAADVFQVTHDRCAVYRLAGTARALK